MNEKLFRKVSIDRVNSPEQLNEYIRTANPSVWVTLGAVLVLLIGIIVWGICGKIETKIDTGSTVEGGQATVYVSGDDITKIADQAKVIIEDKEYEVVSIAKAPVKVDNQMDETAMYYAALEKDDFCYEIKAAANGVKDGAYKTTIITESIKPISLLIK